jgi:hypothetical protein
MYYIEYKSPTYLPMVRVSLIETTIEKEYRKEKPGTDPKKIYKYFIKKIGTYKAKRVDNYFCFCIE